MGAASDSRAGATSDRTVDTTGGAGRNRLQRQAGELLTDTGASREIQQARFGQPANVSQDQVEAALGSEDTASPELLTKLVEQDRSAAADYAVAHTEIQTHALHGVENETFNQEVRLRLTGQPD